ncbi:hypothetical protein FN846DRAFT_938095 [Sphaerosporella brunnea]|uniref:Uncharacterized protein n=1 Tax=Sphaerosporella brunnea TaxID=1250544 RepID=A0A5J5F3E2_9PEZI|nr:hypothetical protein FN846DRAFT_938095 [Sphaerosporella brunnea]
MRTSSFFTLFLVSAAAAMQYAVVPKGASDSNIDFHQPPKLSTPRIAPSIPECPKASETLITLPAPRAQNHERRATESAGKAEGLTARQVVGAIAVAVLVAVV